MTWLYLPSSCFPASACSVKVSEQDLPTWASRIAPSATLSGKLTQPQSWLRAWKKAAYLQRLSGPTLPPSMQELGVARWIASLPDSLARTCPSPASVLGLKGSEAAYSTKSCESQTNQEPLRCFSKTCKVCTAPTDMARDAYVAGIIDGEGSISIQKRGEVRVDVGMAEKAIPLLNWLYQTYGGTVRPTGKETEKWQARYCWTLTTDPAICFLRKMKPFMRIKKDIAEAILEADLVDRNERRGQHRRWTKARFSAFEKARETTMRVNKKGPPEDRGNWIARRVGNRWEVRQANLLTGLSETFNGSWPRAGSMRNGCVYEQPTWEQVMAGRAGSASRGAMWQTPKASEEESGSGMNSRGEPKLKAQANAWLTPHGMSVMDHTGKAGADGEFAKQATNWATPNTLDGMPPKTEKAVQREMTETRPGRSQMANLRDQVIHNWPTPQASDDKRDRGSLEQKERWAKCGNASSELAIDAALWPTPAARDYKGHVSEQSMDRKDGQSRMDQLANAAVYSPLAQATRDGEQSSINFPKSPRHLSPIFGAWLMGWPSTWVIAEPSASSASETAAFRCKLQQHLSCLLDEPESLVKEAT